MARWFKEFPINFRNGTDKIRSVSESDSQNRDKPGETVGLGTKVTNPRGSPSKGSGASNRSGGGVSCLLSGRNRKNSANESCRTVNKDERVWDSLFSGKSRKNSKSLAGSEEHRTLKTCISASTYITRLIKVEKQDRTQNNIAHAPLDEEPNVGKTVTVIIREDYADPFDAQRTCKQNASHLGENDGYMEPYDAQQLITEIRRRGSKDLLKMSALLEGGEGPREDLRSSTPLQIYDDPYGGVLEAPASHPESDWRPPEEYELPWEWRREQILKALSVPLDGADRLDYHQGPVREETPHLSWPQTEHLHRWSWTTRTGALRPPHSQLGGAAEGDAGRVDPSVPLEKQSWYHGSVTRQEVDSQLQSHKEGSFLVRDSESGTSKYSIALKTSQGCVHIIVAQTKENGYTLDQSRCTFPSIPQVVHYYCSQPLPFPGANHMTLMHPVPRPL
ncbi:hypothetical protein ACEWY4_023724 [Coilia grayii]|uniref:SH2 domain-containing adapter protein E n=1 Tax=Coilia grayii TaxID=363190 RepID=A0ABD1IYC4_9TELE